MGVDHRVTHTRRHAYRTKSNKVVAVKTSGGKHVAHYQKKHRSGVACGECHCVLPGIKHMDTAAFHSAKKREKTVSRAYGGSRCGQCVKAKIVRAFLIEEQKIVKRVLAAKKAEKPEKVKADKAPAKKASKK
jgi:large subunit ribosomal protein L34e